MKHMKKLMILGSMIGLMGMSGAAEAGTTVIFSSGPSYHRPQPYYVNTFYGPPTYVAYRSYHPRWHRDYHRHDRRDRHDHRYDRDDRRGHGRH